MRYLGLGLFLYFLVHFYILFAYSMRNLTRAALRFIFSKFDLYLYLFFCICLMYHEKSHPCCSRSCHLKSEKNHQSIGKEALYCEFAKTIDNKNLKPTFMQNLVKEEEEWNQTNGSFDNLNKTKVLSLLLIWSSVGPQIPYMTILLILFLIRKKLLLHWKVWILNDRWPYNRLEDITYV